MDPERMAVVAGWADTRDALARWNRDVPAVLRSWMGTSFLVGCALLIATWGVATVMPSEVRLVGWNFPPDPTLSEAWAIYSRNLLVLAMHALICVAGYMALASLPIATEAYSGFMRKIHEWARPFAVIFVTFITIGSIILQAVTIGAVAPQIASLYGRSVPELLLLISPHALPELTAVFLPLGAWLVLARRKAYKDLLAASILATAVALPLLAMATLVEVYVTPLVLEAFRA